MTLAGQQAGDDALDPRVFEVVQRAAEAEAARRNLHGLGSDLAQQALALLLERLRSENRPFSADEAERLVRRLANAERHARDVERRHLALVRLDGRGFDPLPETCPRLVALARAHARPRAFRTRLGVAAHCLVRHPKILLDDQFRIFDMVWVAGAAPRTAAELLGVSVAAARQRLDRVSERVEKRLLRDLEQAMPGSRWEELHGYLEAERERLPSRAVADALFAGLAQVIHSRSLLPRIEGSE